MGLIGKEEAAKIHQYLEQGGLTYDPLQTELLDHILVDIENMMQQGKSFEVAWSEIKEEIPINHLKNIEKETMETIKSKFNLTRILTIMSGSLLVLASLFKLMHFQGAPEMLIIALFLTAFILLFETSRSMYVYREKKGRLVLLAVTTTIISFISHLLLRLLHLPGSTELTYFSVISIAVLFPALSVQFYLSNRKLRDHLLILLVDKSQKTLEQAAIFLVGFGLLFNYSSGPGGKTLFLGVIFMIFTVILTGLSIYSMSWSYFVKISKEEERSSALALLVCSVTALIMFILPALGRELDIVFRNYMAYGAFIIFIGIVVVHYRKFSESPHRNILVSLSSFLLFYPFFKLGVSLEWFEGFLVGFASNYYLNLGFVLLLGVFLIIFRRERLFKALVIVMIASHMIPLGQ